MIQAKDFTTETQEEAETKSKPQTLINLVFRERQTVRQADRQIMNQALQATCGCASSQVHGRDSWFSP